MLICRFRYDHNSTADGNAIKLFNKMRKLFPILASTAHKKKNENMNVNERENEILFCTFEIMNEK